MATSRRGNAAVQRTGSKNRFAAPYKVTLRAERSNRDGRLQYRVILWSDADVVHEDKIFDDLPAPHALWQFARGRGVQGIGKKSWQAYMALASTQLNQDIIIWSQAMQDSIQSSKSV